MITPALGQIAGTSILRTDRLASRGSQLLRLADRPFFPRKWGVWGGGPFFPGGGGKPRGGACGPRGANRHLYLSVSPDFYGSGLRAPRRRRPAERPEAQPVGCNRKTIRRVTQRREVNRSGGPATRRISLRIDHYSGQETRVRQFSVVLCACHRSLSRSGTAISSPACDFPRETSGEERSGTTRVPAPARHGQNHSPRCWRFTRWKRQAFRPRSDPQRKAKVLAGAARLANNTEAWEMLPCAGSTAPAAAPRRTRFKPTATSRRETGTSTTETICGDEAVHRQMALARRALLFCARQTACRAALEVQCSPSGSSVTSSMPPAGSPTANS